MNSAFISAPEDDMAVVPTDGPGGHLRTARQAAGLTQGQVAKQLYLAPAIIEALECEAHEALPEPVFITGYIRKYARLVGLAPEPLLAAYRAPVLQQADSVWPADHESNGNYLKLGLVSLGIFILLGVASFLWRQGRQPETITTGGMAEMMVPAIVPEVAPGLFPATGAEPVLSPKSDLPGSRRSSPVATGEEREHDSGEPPIRASRFRAVLPEPAAAVW